MMDTLGEKLKKRFELFGNFLSGILTPGPGHGTGSSTSSSQPGRTETADIYDDTGGHTDVLEFQPGQGQWNPRPRDTHPRGDSSGQTSLFQGTTPGFGPAPHFSPFGSLFREFSSVVEEIEESIRIMEHEISNSIANLEAELPRMTFDDEDDGDQRYFRFFGRPGQGSLDLGSIPGVVIEELPDNYEELNKSSSSKAGSDSNCRDLMLKKPDKPKSPSPGHGGYDMDNNDGLVSRSLWDMLGLFSGDRLEPGSSSTSGSFFNFRSETNFSSSTNGKLKMQKTIRETPEGKEIITVRTDENGQVHEEREFIPRADLPQSHPDPSKSNVFKPFFRPKF